MIKKDIQGFNLDIFIYLRMQDKMIWKMDGL